MLSDMDVSVRSLDTGKKLVQGLRSKGRNVLEYGDRWVDTTTDTTIWKPGRSADHIGSSSYEAGIILDTLPGSDKFSTQAGRDFAETGSTGDALGLVIANVKKAAESGLEGPNPDLHVISKSVVKAAEASNTPLPQKLEAQLRALREHRTPEEAGVVTPGASPEVQQREIAAFQKEAQTALAESHRNAQDRSASYLAGLQKDLAAAVKGGDKAGAQKLREQIAGYRLSNKTALATIADIAPVYTAQVTPIAPTGPNVRGPASATASGSPLGVGGLTRLAREEEEASAKLPAIQFNAKDPGLGNLSERLKEAAPKVEDKRKAAKPGSEEATYLAELKAVFERGVANPADAIEQTRLLSGHELPQVLRQLGVGAKKP